MSECVYVNAYVCVGLFFVFHFSIFHFGELFVFSPLNFSSFHLFPFPCPHTKRLRMRSCADIVFVHIYYQHMSVLFRRDVFDVMFFPYCNVLMLFFVRLYVMVGWPPQFVNIDFSFLFFPFSQFVFLCSETCVYNFEHGVKVKNVSRQ